jgi:multifunctional methyltransferase subunit TRM112
MRLLTHNHLRCHAKDVTHGGPLLLEVTDFEVDETEYNVAFLQSILPTLDWNAVQIEAKAIGVDGIPTEWDPKLLNDDDFLRAMHRLLLDVHIVEGTLTCPESGRKFPIEKGIAKMM